MNERSSDQDLDCLNHPCSPVHPRSTSPVSPGYIPDGLPGEGHAPQGKNCATPPQLPSPCGSSGFGSVHNFWEFLSVHRVVSLLFGQLIVALSSKPGLGREVDFVLQIHFRVVF